MSKVDHPIMLIVLDGWGHSDDTEHNAIYSAHKPTWDRLWNDHPHSLIRCSGNDVGLPDQQMGNSEVGHMHLGSGRLVNQDLTRISQSISNREFYANPIIKPALERVANSGNALHVLGLLSPGGVHSHEEHLLALLELAKQTGVARVYIHAFLDGRDTPPRSATASIKRVEEKCTTLGIGNIVSVIGRYYAMDRNKNWARTQSAYELIVNGCALHEACDARTAVEQAYQRGEGDEFVEATAIASEHAQRIRVEDGDVIVFTNFRADRARQLTTSFTDPSFTEFERSREVTIDSFITMTSYGASFELPMAFAPVTLENTYGDWIARHGLRQLRIAETEKYAHVTFFFNGGVETLSAGEDRVLVESPNIATYDLKPEMSANEVTDKLVEALTSRTYDTIICNYANADMVGHTGDFTATVRSIETLDKCLERIISVAQTTGTEVLITADHGNAEKMRATSAEHSQPHTAHTSNLVPLIYIGRPAEMAPSGCLTDIAPTMLSLIGLEVPAEMTGHSLVALKE